MDFEESLLERLTTLEEQVRKSTADTSLLLDIADTLEAEFAVGRAAWLALADELHGRGVVPRAQFRRRWSERLDADLGAAAIKERFLSRRELLGPPSGLSGRRRMEWEQAMRQIESLLLGDETEAALAAMAKLHRLRPAAALAELLGLAALQREEFAAAGRHFQEALSGSEGDDAALGLAAAEYLRGRASGARAAALLIRAPAPRLLLLGLAALQGGAPREAAAHFAQLAESGAEELPGGALGQATWLYYWGRALAAAGENGPAAAALDEALTRDPHHRSALAFRAYLAARAGAPARAKALYAVLARLDSDGPEAKGSAVAQWRAGARGKFPAAPPPFAGAGAEDLSVLLGLTRARARAIVRETAG